MKFYKPTAVFLVLLLALAPLVGCTQQQTIAGIIGDIGAATSTILTIENVDSGTVAKVQADFHAAQTAVLAWKSGTPTQNVVQALNLFVGDLNLLPVSQKAAAFIQLAVSLTQNLIIEFGGTVGPQLANGRAVTVTPTGVVLPSDKKLKALRAANKAKWNAAIGDDLYYSAAKIK